MAWFRSQIAIILVWGIEGSRGTYKGGVAGEMSTVTELRLQDFDISEDTGFVPSSAPLTSLPEYFTRWEALARNLPALIRDRRIREEVHALPPLEFSGETLTSEREWQRAYVLLTFLAQAYIWVEGEGGLPDRVPKLLAVPWKNTADRLGLNPCITYASTVLYNWKLLDSSGLMDENNLQAVVTFTGTKDESWFYMVDVVLELAAAPGLKSIAHAYSSMINHDHQALVQDLWDVRSTLERMLETLLKMYDQCDPKVFYVKIRPFQAGSKGLQAFPTGLLYEGVDPEPLQFNGASAAQSSSVHVFDVFLGGKHTGSDAEFLQDMRLYMPAKHRDFLEALSRQPSVREYIKQSKDGNLIAAYNGAVEALGQFRSQHVILVTRYIVCQKKHSVNTSLDMRGTGGTPFMSFLKQVRDDTLALQLQTE